jgi:hypothetical protein
LVCQSQTESIKLDPDNLGEGQLVRTATFDGNSLWGYINGGADIYLEYGFSSLLVNDIKFRGETIKFDLYRMSDPLAAFGIFSVYSFRCDSTTGHGIFNCVTKWQIQSVNGEYYLSVILPTGSPEELAYASGIAAILLSKTGGTPFMEGDIFAKDRFDSIKGRIQYSRGRLGIDNGISFNAEGLAGIEFKDLWHISGIEGTNKLTVTAITFTSPAGLDEFVTNTKSLYSAASGATLYRHINGITAIIADSSGEKYDPSTFIKWFSGIRQ